MSYNHQNFQLKRVATETVKNLIYIQFNKRQSQVYKFGRQSTCDFKLQSTKISKEHCLISFKADKVFVINLTNTAGSYVNNTKLGFQETVEIVENDIIGFGVDPKVHNQSDKNQFVYRLCRHKTFDLETDSDIEITENTEEIITIKEDSGEKDRIGIQEATNQRKPEEDDPHSDISAEDGVITTFDEINLFNPLLPGCEAVPDDSSSNLLSPPSTEETQSYDIDESASFKQSYTKQKLSNKTENEVQSLLENNLTPASSFENLNLLIATSEDAASKYKDKDKKKNATNQSTLDQKIPKQLDIPKQLNKTQKAAATNSSLGDKLNPSTSKQAREKALAVLEKCQKEQEIRHWNQRRVQLIEGPLPDPRPKKRGRPSKKTTEFFESSSDDESVTNRKDSKRAKKSKTNVPESRHNVPKSVKKIFDTKTKPRKLKKASEDIKTKLKVLNSTKEDSEFSDDKFQPKRNAPIKIKTTKESRGDCFTQAVPINNYAKKKKKND